MKIKTTDTNRTYELTARTFDESTCTWSPDFFSDREEVFAPSHDVEPGSDVILATQEEVTDLIDFWEDEFRKEGEGVEFDVCIEPMTRAECYALAQNLGWDPTDKEDTLDSLRTNWEIPLLEEEVQMTYDALVEIWNQTHDTEKTVYRVITDTVEVTSNSRTGDGHLIGRPFPRAMSADEIEDVYFAAGPEGHTVADYLTREEAEQAAEKISISTDLYDWTVPFIRADIVRVEEVMIDSDGNEDFTGCWLFRCNDYTPSDAE